MHASTVKDPQDGPTRHSRINRSPSIERKGQTRLLKRVDDLHRDPASANTRPLESFYNYTLNRQRLLASRGQKHNLLPSRGQKSSESPNTQHEVPQRPQGHTQQRLLAHWQAIHNEHINQEQPPCERKCRRHCRRRDGYFSVPHTDAGTNRHRLA